MDRHNIFSLRKLYRSLSGAYGYFISGVWKDPRNNIWIRIVKTMNLSVSSFLDRNLQNKSMALTYSTVLAIVPGFALILAIGRGFGLSEIISTGLYDYFPVQQKAIGTALSFVDSYLNQASKGIFVGAGIILLLWTLISLLSNIEDNFNRIWDIRKSRSPYQKITDYIALCLIIPVLMICSSGIAIFLSTVLHKNLAATFLSPFIDTLLRLTPVILAWIAFSLSFYIIPNTKVNFKYALISGALCAAAYQTVQILFVNGQIYVSKYNAIYGSFSFLPLLLIWLQISWLILLFGCVLTFSLQNVFSYNYSSTLSNISTEYMRQITLIVTAIIFQRFKNNRKPISSARISIIYRLPARLVNNITENLLQAGIIYTVTLEKGNEGLTPALDIRSLSIGELFSRLDAAGDSGFIPGFNKTFIKYIEFCNHAFSGLYAPLRSRLVTDVDIPSPEQISDIVKNQQ